MGRGGFALPPFCCWVVNFEQFFFVRVGFLASLFGNGGLVFGLLLTPVADATGSVCGFQVPFLNEWDGGQNA